MTYYSASQYKYNDDQENLNKFVDAPSPSSSNLVEEVQHPCGPLLLIGQHLYQFVRVEKKLVID